MDVISFVISVRESLESSTPTAMHSPGWLCEMEMSISKNVGWESVKMGVWKDNNGVCLKMGF